MMFKRVFLTLVLILSGLDLGRTDSRADTVATVNADGYTLQANGYYTYGASAQLYYRSQEYISGYWSCGVYYPGYYRYRYFPYNGPPISYQPPAFPAFKKFDWKEAVEKWKLEKLDHESYLQVQRELNAGSPPIGGYGFDPSKGTLYGNAYQSLSFGAQGNTVYGYPVGPNSYSLSRALDFYGDTNALAMHQISGQLVNNLTSATGQAMNGHQQILDKFEGNRARFAQEAIGGANALVKAQGMAILLDALKQAFANPPAQQVNGFSFKFVPSANGGMKMMRGEEGVTREQRKMLDAQFTELFQAKCAACHSGNNRKGGFDLQVYQQMTVEQKSAAPNGPWFRIVTPDQDKVMPRAPGGGPGERLLPDEVRIFTLN
jgi:hypothetical protein